MPLYLNGKQISPVVLKKSSIEDYNFYEGPYVINPLTTTSSILQTEQKILEQNIIVNKIRFSEVSNTSGGTTAYIGI